MPFRFPLLLLLCTVLGLIGHCQTFPEKRDSLNELLGSANPKRQITLYYELARLYSSQDLDSSRLYLKKGISAAQKAGDKFSEAQMHNGLGITYYMGGQLDIATWHYQKSLELNRAINNKQGVLLNTSNLANVYMDKGESFKAMESYQNGLQLAEELKDSSTMADIYNNMARLYQVLGDPQKCINILRKSIELERITERENVISSFNNLGSIYYDLNKRDSALYCYRRAKNIAFAIQDQEGIMYSTNNLARLFADLKEVDSARYYFNYSIRKSESTPFMELELSSILGLANLDYVDKNYALARQRIDHVIDEAKSRGMLMQLHSAIGLQHQYLAATGSHQEAYDALKTYVKLTDSIKGINKLEDIARLELQYNYEREQALREQEDAFKKDGLEQEIIRKDKLNHLSLGLAVVLVIVIGLQVRNLRLRKKANVELELKNTLIEEQNKKITEQKEKLQNQHDHLEELNDFKNKVMAVMAHDLKSPLASLQNLLQLVDEGHLEDPKVFQDLASKLNAQTLGLVQNVDNLLHWAQLQFNSNMHATPHPESPDAVVADVLELYKPMLEEKQVQMDCQMDKHPEDKFINGEVGRLILRNFLSNAIKFSPEQGTITLSCSPTPKGIRFTVADQGQGIAQDVQKQLFGQAVPSSTGTKKEKGTGLGLMLSSEFAELDGGEVGVDSLPGFGSNFWFELPWVESSERLKAEDRRLKTEDWRLETEDSRLKTED